MLHHNRICALYVLPPPSIVDFIKSRFGVTACENAHLVPCERNDWFKGNGMDQFCLTYDATINDVANGVALRADVRACLDRHSFVFFPRGDGTFVSYVIKNEKDYAQLLHRRSINIHERVAEEFLYARFAYTVIHLVSPSWDEPHLSVPIPLSGLAARPVTPRTGPSAGTAGKIEESTSSTLSRIWFHSRISSSRSGCTYGRSSCSTTSR